MNRKGLWAGNVYLDTFSILAFVSIAAVFFVLFTVQGDRGEVAIEGKANEVSSNLVLLNYLRTPVDVNNKTIKMSELIALTYNDRSLRGILDNKTTEALSSAIYIYKKGSNEIEVGYEISIYEKKGYPDRFAGSGAGAGGTPTTSVDAYVPVSINKTAYVELQRYN